MGPSVKSIMKVFTRAVAKLDKLEASKLKEAEVLYKRAAVIQAEGHAAGNESVYAGTTATKLRNLL